MHWLIAYVVCLIIFAVLDGLWITLVARKQYEFEASDVLRKKPQLSAGILFYLIYIAGVLTFATLPMVKHFDGIHATVATYRDVILWGAGLGLFAYATFALTNQTIIKDWKYKLVIADTLWGAFLTALLALVGFGVIRVLA